MIISNPSVPILDLVGTTGLAAQAVGAICWTASLIGAARTQAIQSTVLLSASLVYLPCWWW
ncbi:MAG: hypothetical protein V3T17_06300 [Pseudomonadales bacterium]